MLPLKKKENKGEKPKKIADGGMDRLKFICFIMNNIFYICVIYPASFYHPSNEEKWIFWKGRSNHSPIV